MLNNKLNIHKNIYDKLDNFIKINQVPNILLHGPVGSGKRTIIFDFVRKLYKDNQHGNVLYVECGYGKGIKFIREEVNYFAKTNSNTSLFKTIVLLNADKLTIDAQSALRRSMNYFVKPLDILLYYMIKIAIKSINSRFVNYSFSSQSLIIQAQLHNIENKKH